MKTLSILGSTGSIGQNVLEVVRHNRTNFKIFALSCHTNIELVKLQCLEFSPNFVVVSTYQDAKKLADSLRDKVDTEVLFEDGALSFIVQHADVTHVVAAIANSAGLKSTYDASKAGKEILLANKESMVMAGPLILSQASENNSRIIPIDSEHNAIYQVLHNEKNIESQVKKVILTASGGPFLKESLDNMDSATVEQALNHPNWKMGEKITIDSATMMNKALEVIEAYYLFNLSKTKIDVVVHPQSIIHSMVEFIDGSILCQLGFSDMKIPISYALGYPERITSGLEGIDLTTIENLSFSKPDFQKFPCLKLAYDVLGKKLSHSIVLNIANEIAVGLFLDKKIKFNQIFMIVNEMLNKLESKNLRSIDDIFSFSELVDKQTRFYLQEHYKI
ncbi:MAG: 1-deoxy-D-xylulose-5-phosphate reductoisomerase [Methylophilaceae bacterium]|nr:1-deoxy-D-xylulose-5-phosphate reductoisomerase [Methylophilaceae bacterium]